MHGRERVWASLTLCLCWIAIAADRVMAGRPGELLWTCYVAVAMMALSALAGRSRPLAAGLLFHAAVGAPAYGLQVLVTGQATPAAVLAHVLPVAVGARIIRSAGYPKHTLPGALALHAACWSAAWLWTDPRFNVNLAHKLWPPLLPQFEDAVLARGGAVLAVCLLLWAGDWLVRRLLHPRAGLASPADL